MTTDPNPLQERIAGKLCDPARHVAHWPLVGIDPYCDQCYTQAAAVLPLIAAEVRKAQGEAWTDCISEASALGWLHAPAALDMLDRNPHETEDQT